MANLRPHNYNFAKPQSVGFSAGLRQTNYCDFEYGEHPLRKGLEALAVRVGAEAVTLLRLSPADSNSRQSPTFDRSTAATEKALSRSFVQPAAAGMKPGSIWSMSNGSDVSSGQNADCALTRFHRDRGLCDFAVITLEKAGSGGDFIEMHFAAAITPDARMALETLADKLSVTWRAHVPGLFTDTLLRLGSAPEATRSAPAILSMENPAGLSRTEYRVCLLLSHGKAPATVRSELNIGQSTFRTHLRNVFAKTGAETHVALLHQLVSGAPFSGPAAKCTGTPAC